MRMTSGKGLCPKCTREAAWLPAETTGSRHRPWLSGSFAFTRRSRKRSTQTPARRGFQQLPSRLPHPGSARDVRPQVTGCTRTTESESAVKRNALSSREKNLRRAQLSDRRSPSEQAACDAVQARGDAAGCWGWGGRVAPLGQGSCSA